MSDVATLVAALHARGRPGVIAVTGGGGDLIAALLSVPGASRTLLDAVVPYAEGALTHFLGKTPSQSCSPETARDMAAAARARAESLAPGSFGLGVTASLATDRPKRGEHRFHIALDAPGRRVGVSLTLEKGARDRTGEDRVLTLVALSLLLPEATIVPPLRPGETLVPFDTGGPDALDRLLSGHTPVMLQEIDGRWVANPPPPRLLLSGSFNPLHAGHVELAEAAARATGLPVAYELGVRNADKPPLDRAEVLRRLAAFRWLGPVWLGREPYFAGMAEHYPGAAFVLGIDTAVRVLDPKYYGGEPGRDAALARIEQSGCRFVVAGRAGRDGAFVPAESLAAPPRWRALFEALPESAFRRDVSSTQIRASVGG